MSGSSEAQAKAIQTTSTHPVETVTAIQDEQPAAVKNKAVNSDDDDDGDDEVTFTATHMPPWRRRLVVLSLCLTLFLGALDITIISTALPTVARELGMGGREYAWVGSGYNLANTASMLVWTRASDVLGRKPVVAAAACLFMAGSAVCARAASPGMLIAGRVVQGLGGGGSFVLTTVIISDLFPLADRAKYYGLTGMVWGIAASVGPILGGVFAQSAGWRWCFYINLPVDGVALAFILLFLHVDIKRTPLAEGIRSLDWTGFALVIGGTVSFLYGLEAGASHLAPWRSAKVIALIVCGALLLALFLAWEALAAAAPILPFRVFRDRGNVAALAVGGLHAFVFISFDFFLPLYFQAVLGLTPILSAAALFALIVPLSAATLAGSAVIRRTGHYKLLIIGGAAVMCLGNGLFLLLGARRDWARVVAVQVVAGLGAGTMFQSPMIALQSRLRQRDTAAAVGAYSFVRNLATSMSVVVGTVLVQRGLPGGSFVGGSGHGGGGGGGGGGARPVDKGEYVRALHVMWAFYTGVAGLLLMAGLFIRQTALTAPGSDGEKSAKSLETGAHKDGDADAPENKEADASKVSSTDSVKVPARVETKDAEKEQASSESRL